MSRENKKEVIASLHREHILRAAEELFSEKGYEATTIADISNASAYSRRTIYAYYESKEDILHHIVEKGLRTLKRDLTDAVNCDRDFITQYKDICLAIGNYQNECPHSMEQVNRANASEFDFENSSDTVKRILVLGSEINDLLKNFIEKGQNAGIVRQDIVPAMTVYILYAGITSLFTLAKTKGQFINKEFSISKNDFLEYGFLQLINSVLEVRIQLEKT